MSKHRDRIDKKKRRSRIEEFEKVSKTVKRMHRKLPKSTREQFDKMLRRLARKQRALALTIEDWTQRVHDPHEGDSQTEQLDAFDPTSLDRAEKVIAELYVFQEMGKIFGLDPEVRQRIMDNLVDRRLPTKAALVPAQPHTPPPPAKPGS